MDPRLQILQHLYGEAEDRSAVVDALGADADLRAEHRELAEAKFCLDHRRRARPDAAVLDRVVAHAAAAVAPPAAPAGSPRPDRRPRARARHRRAFAALVVGAVVTASVGLGLFTLQETGGAAPSPPAAVAAPPSLVLTPTDVSRASISTLEAYARARQSDVLGWDEGDEVRSLRRRVDLLEARSTVPARGR